MDEHTDQRCCWKPATPRPISTGRINNQPENDFRATCRTGKMNPPGSPTPARPTPRTTSTRSAPMRSGAGVDLERPGPADGRHRHTASAASMSYVTGTHNVKFGLQDSFGPATSTPTARRIWSKTTTTARRASPCTRPRPTGSSRELRHGVLHPGVWTIKRLTLNPGIRLENFSPG